MKQDIVARTGILVQSLITRDAGMFSIREMLMEALTLTFVHALIAMVAELGVSVIVVTVTMVHALIAIDVKLEVPFDSQSDC